MKFYLIYKLINNFYIFIIKTYYIYFLLINIFLAFFLIFLFYYFSLTICKKRYYIKILYLRKCLVRLDSIFSLKIHITEN